MQVLAYLHYTYNTSAVYLSETVITAFSFVNLYLL